MERITSAQPPPCMPNHPALDIADLQGMDFPMSYVCKPRRGMKRGDDSKEAYKMPHRLIEKKRRDRINECIAQLKDLLPEHLKLTTLGHLEKAVVLELTLKHVKALSALLEQQQQKIIALQNGLHIGDHGRDSSESSEEMFRSGFHLCASEVLQYVTRQEPGRDLTPSRVIGHIHKLAAEVLRRRASPREEEEEEEEEEEQEEQQEQEQEEVRGPFEEPDKPAGCPARALEGHAQNCVPVIQRTCPHGAGELSGSGSGSDTDTDSGYGGEQEKRDPKAFPGKAGELKHSLADIKQETNGPPAKRPRSDSSGDEALGGGPGSYVSFSHNQPSFCLPFYLIPPAAAAYLPMLEKCWYAGGMPIVYPGMSASAAPESLPSSLVMSPRAGSPVPHQTSMDSPALLQALKQVPPLNLDSTE